MSVNLFSLRERLGEAGALIAFSGSFSHSLIEELGLAVRKYLESESVKRSAMMDVFSVYVEASQNVRNYTGLKLQQADLSISSSSIIVIAKRNDHYEVNAGNMIAQDDIAELRARLQELQALDKAELKSLYKEQLRKERAPESVGAGLGLIDMARRASSPLQFEFSPVNDRYSFFSLKVVI